MDMVYVALLRGINVGGNNKISMAELKVVFQNAGMSDVTTYINSGNVIFQSDLAARALPPLLEKAIDTAFGFAVMVIVRSIDQIYAVTKALPDEWQNNLQTKCDVFFLHHSVDSPKIIDHLPVKAGVDHLIYVPGAVIWSIDRALVNRSGLLRIVGTDLYKNITIRNCNTARKLYAIMATHL